MMMSSSRTSCLGPLSALATDLGGWDSAPRCTGRAAQVGEEAFNVKLWIFLPTSSYVEAVGIGSWVLQDLEGAGGAGGGPVEPM